ncbi:MAG TPA: hypothetical protein VFC56_12435 [Stellaceae bacterium]|nr:hypothetical protein [Stellaceae bacterium]
MKPPTAAVLAILALSGCAPYPVYVSQGPMPLLAYREHQEECTVIRREIARQQRIAETSGVMATALVEASVRLNVSNAISGLESRAALAGCPV